MKKNIKREQQRQLTPQAHLCAPVISNNCSPKDGKRRVKVVNLDPLGPTLFAANFISKRCTRSYSVLHYAHLGAFIPHTTHTIHKGRRGFLWKSSVQLHNFARRQQKCQREGLSRLPRFLLVGNAASGASTCYTFEI